MENDSCGGVGHGRKSGFGNDRGHRSSSDYSIPAELERGYLAFLDPPKDTAATAIRALEQHGVSVKIVTGDNDLVARKLCSEAGQCAVVVRFRLFG